MIYLPTDLRLGTNQIAENCDVASMLQHLDMFVT